MYQVERLDAAELERRKDRFRRLFSYRRVDRIPIGFWYDDFSTHTLHEQCRDTGLQLELMVAGHNRAMRLFDDDYIPMVRIWPGYVTIATMFGMEIFWGDDPFQAPGSLGHLVESVDDIAELSKPDPYSDGLMPNNLKWLRHAAENLPPDIAITGIDLGGPLNSAKDLFETNFLYTAFLDYPSVMHACLDLLTEVQAACYRAVIDAVGGMNRLVSMDFDPVWAPEGMKGFVSDDVCASISPAAFQELSMPYNERLFREFGPGRLHNCGPHPSVGLYCRHKPACFGINCSFKYTKPELTAFKSSFSQQGIIELNFDNDESPEEVVAGYEEAANILAPEVAAVPVLVYTEAWSDDDLRAAHQSLKRIARDYADAVNWFED